MHCEQREQKGKEPIGERLPAFLPPLYRKYFTAVLKGDHFAPTPIEAKKAVDEHFAYTPSTPLTKEQESLLRADMHRQYRDTFRDSKWNGVSGEIYLLPGDSTMSDDMYGGLWRGETILMVGEKARQAGEALAIKPLTPEEKESLLTDPATYAELRLEVGNCSGGLLSNGTRHLTDEQDGGFVLDEKVLYDSYGYTIRDFHTMLSTVRSAQDKSEDAPLRGLDIGGSNGLGAYMTPRHLIPIWM